MDGRTYTLIHKEITGELSESEAQELRSIQDVVDTREVREDLSLIWNLSKEYYPQQDWKADDAKAQFLSRINEEKSTLKSAEKSTRSNSGKYILMGLGLLLAVAVVVYLTTNDSPELEMRANDEIMYAALEDDTKVWLGQNSALSFDNSGDRRVAKLEGEAIFDVAPDPDVPFSVDLGGATFAEVLGTSFKASSTDNEGNATIQVREGQVRFYNIEQSEYNLILQAGEEGVINIQSDVVNRVSSATTASLSQGDFPAMTDVSLSEAFEILSNVYGVNISYDAQRFSTCAFGTGLNARVGLQDILDAIQEIHPQISITAAPRSTYVVTGTCS